MNDIFRCFPVGPDLDVLNKPFCLIGQASAETVNAEMQSFEGVFFDVAFLGRKAGRLLVFGPKMREMGQICMILALLIPVVLMRLWGLTR